MAEETSVPENPQDIPVPENRLDFGKLDFGCSHYRRRCKIRAPCCNRIFTCRHCHNEAISSSSNIKEHHEIIRRDIKQVVCAVCDTEQPVAKVCCNCGVNMGEYFCEVCNFYDDEIDRKQFHCTECEICRIGGRENFFHCPKCGSCYSITLQDNHECVQDSMKNFCPICYEYLFDSTKVTQVMRCGHTIHMDCYGEMLEQKQYRCPLCSKSTVDMTRNWEMLDEEIGAAVMPDEYRHEVSILCNDCSGTCSVKHHIFGHKCSHCNSYNTRVTKNFGPQPQQEPPSDD